MLSNAQDYTHLRERCNETDKNGVVTTLLMGTTAFLPSTRNNPDQINYNQEAVSNIISGIAPYVPAVLNFLSNYSAGKQSGSEGSREPAGVEGAQSSILPEIGKLILRNMLSEDRNQQQPQESYLTSKFPEGSKEPAHVEGAQSSILPEIRNLMYIPSEYQNRQQPEESDLTSKFPQNLPLDLSDLLLTTSGPEKVIVRPINTLTSEEAKQNPQQAERSALSLYDLMTILNGEGDTEELNKVAREEADRNCTDFGEEAIVTAKDLGKELELSVLPKIERTSLSDENASANIARLSMNIKDFNPDMLFEVYKLCAMRAGGELIGDCHDKQLIFHGDISKLRKYLNEAFHGWEFKPHQTPGSVTSKEESSKDTDVREDVSELKRLLLTLYKFNEHAADHISNKIDANFKRLVEDIQNGTYERTMGVTIDAAAIRDVLLKGVGSLSTQQPPTQTDNAAKQKPTDSEMANSVESSDSDHDADVEEDEIYEPDACYHVRSNKEGNVILTYDIATDVATRAMEWACDMSNMFRFSNLNIFQHLEDKLKYQLEKNYEMYGTITAKAFICPITDCCKFQIMWRDDALKGCKSTDNSTDDSTDDTDFCPPDILNESQVGRMVNNEFAAIRGIFNMKALLKGSLDDIESKLDKSSHIAKNYSERGIENLRTVVNKLIIHVCDIMDQIIIDEPDNEDSYRSITDDAYYALMGHQMLSHPTLMVMGA